MAQPPRPGQVNTPSPVCQQLQVAQVSYCQASTPVVDTEPRYPRAGPEPFPTWTCTPGAPGPTDSPRLASSNGWVVGVDPWTSSRTQPSQWHVWHPAPANTPFLQLAGGPSLDLQVDAPWHNWHWQPLPLAEFLSPSRPTGAASGASRDPVIGQGNSRHATNLSFQVTMAPHGPPLIAFATNSRGDSELGCGAGLAAGSAGGEGRHRHPRAQAGGTALGPGVTATASLLAPKRVDECQWIWQPGPPPSPAIPQTTASGIPHCLSYMCAWPAIATTGSPGVPVRGAAASDLVSPSGQGAQLPVFTVVGQKPAPRFKLIKRMRVAPLGRLPVNRQSKSLHNTGDSLGSTALVPAVATGIGSHHWPESDSEALMAGTHKRARRCGSADLQPSHGRDSGLEGPASGWQLDSQMLQITGPSRTLAVVAPAPLQAGSAGIAQAGTAGPGPSSECGPRWNVTQPPSPLAGPTQVETLAAPTPALRTSCDPEPQLLVRSAHTLAGAAGGASTDDAAGHESAQADELHRDDSESELEPELRQCRFCPYASRFSTQVTTAGGSLFSVLGCLLMPLLVPVAG
jgi:hypothetical protein